MSGQSPDFLRDDPMTRAFYSGRPAFTQGANAPHPITSAKKSLLAQPEIAEALEVVHVMGLAEQSGILEIAEDMQLVDSRLATAGLNRIRDEIKEDSGRDTRQNAIDAKGWLKTFEHAQEQEEEDRRRREEQAQAAEAEQQAAARAEEAKEAERAAHEERQVTYRSHFAMAAEAVREDRPDLDFTRIDRLVAGLEVVEESDKPVCRKTPQFETQIADLATQHLEDPSRGQSEMEALLLAAQHAVKEGGMRAVVAYTELISASLSAQLETSFYSVQRFSPELAGTWLETMVVDEPERAGILRRRKKRETAGSEQSFGNAILVNSMRKIAREQPKKLIDFMYMIAEAGVESGDEDIQNVAASTLSRYLYGDSLAAHILYMSEVSRNPKRQRRAIDIHQSLEHILRTDGVVPSGEVLSKMGRDMNDDDFRIINKNFRDVLNVRLPTNIIVASINLDELHGQHTDEFKAWATGDDPDARDTLYARLTA